MGLFDPQDVISSPEGASREYWRETQRPFCNLVFLLPLLLIYEFGVHWAGSQGSVRNGADAWMRVWLHQAGLEIVWMPPILLLVALLVWQLRSRQPWKTTWDTLGGMAAESLLYAFLLIMLGQLTDYSFRHASWARMQVDESFASTGVMVRIVSFMGAGIYEEFLFRLCLVPLTYVVFRGLLLPKKWSVVGTVITTSVVFSLAHYLGPSTNGHALAMLSDAAVRVQSSRELWFGFCFRTLAGMFFAVLYFLRGFGITVGAHATYDVFVGVVLIGEL